MTKCNHEELSFSNCRKRHVRWNFAGGSISSNGGALLLREVDRRLGLTARVARALGDGRQRGKVRHEVVTMVRQRVHAVALGYGPRANWRRPALRTERRRALRPGIHTNPDRVQIHRNADISLRSKLAPHTPSLSSCRSSSSVSSSRSTSWRYSFPRRSSEPPGSDPICSAFAALSGESRRSSTSRSTSGRRGRCRGAAGGREAVPRRGCTLSLCARPGARWRRLPY